MKNRKSLMSNKDLLTRSPQEMRPSPHDCAVCAIVKTIEAVQQMALAFAEPQRGLDRVYRARKSLERALDLLSDEVQRPIKRASKLRPSD